mmetsp:Transcript_20500/g.68830  ORF Transcript_20500/g.68830 Transcript_20500/m.68830 type:complete len:224 (-) Transcript_20500:77-748(-)
MRRHGLRAAHRVREVRAAHREAHDVVALRGPGGAPLGGVALEVHDEEGRKLVDGHALGGPALLLAVRAGPVVPLRERFLLAQLADAVVQVDVPVIVHRRGPRAAAARAAEAPARLAPGRRQRQREPHVGVEARGLVPAGGAGHHRPQLPLEQVHHDGGIALEVVAPRLCGNLLLALPVLALHVLHVALAHPPVEILVEAVQQEGGNLLRVVLAGAAELGAVGL